MRSTTIIDGNNLLFAMHASAPGRPIGRQELAVRLDRFSRRMHVPVVVVFDGPEPRGGIARQFDALSIDVLFSGPLTADDVIIEMLDRIPERERTRVITSDHAIRHAARTRRMKSVKSEDFVGELLSGLFGPRPAEAKTDATGPPVEPPEKPEPDPENIDPEDVEFWLQQMADDEDDDSTYWQWG